MSCISVQEVLSFRCMKMVSSLLLYNAHLSVAHPGFLGLHNTLPCVLMCNQKAHTKNDLGLASCN